MTGALLFQARGQGFGIPSRDAIVNPPPGRCRVHAGTTLLQPRNWPVSDIYRTVASFRIGTDPFKFRGVMTDASAITKLLGIQPTHSQNAGEPHGRSGRPWTNGLWCLESQLQEDQELELHVKSLLVTLLPVSDRVRAYLDSDPRLGAEFFVGLYIKENNEMLTLTPESVRGMSELRADLTLDIYLEDVPEDSKDLGESTV